MVSEPVFGTEFCWQSLLHENMFNEHKPVSFLTNKRSAVDFRTAIEKSIFIKAKTFKNQWAIENKYLSTEIWQRDDFIFSFQIQIRSLIGIKILNQ